MLLGDAVRANVIPGDAIHVYCGHTRWSPAATEVVRQWWGRDPGFTLEMLSLSSLGTLWFRGGLVRKVVTGYSGDVFPNFTPNPVFSEAYLSGAVEVEHWSFLAFALRYEAAARGLPVAATRSLLGSSMETNPGVEVFRTAGGDEVALLEAHAPDVALVHGAVADAEGNVALHPPLLEGVWGALAARRGVIATVERIVPDIRPWSNLVVIPSHRTLSVSECPFGAHPGGLYGRFTPAEPYAEDLDFWTDARDATRGDDLDGWIRRWVLDLPDHAAYLEQLGAPRLATLSDRARADSWRDDEAANPPDLTAPVNAWERAAVHGARVLATRIEALGADVALAGAGVANLATWLGVRMAAEAGAKCRLVAELGLLGYEPTPADPFVFNHRAFPSATMLGDSSMVLGGLIPGPGTVAIGCLGAAIVDQGGDIDSTVVPGSAFLVGSGGGNDVASSADEVVLVTTLTPRRTVERVPYVTSPGRRVSVLATDLCCFERRDGRLELSALADGVDVDEVASVCGWDLGELARAGEVPRMDPVTLGDVEPLRRWDPQGRFLRP